MPKTKLPPRRTPEGQLKQMAFEKQRLKEMMQKLKDKKFGPVPPPVKGGRGTGRPVRKAFKKGGFPDLSGDGKTTMKDILIGRGVIKKEGGGSNMRRGKMGGGMMKKRMKRGGMAKKKRVKKALGGVLSMGLKALKKKRPEKKGGKMGGGQDASTMKPSKPSGPGGRKPRDAMKPARRKMMGGGMMKKRMKRGGRAMKRGGGMMKKRMKRGGIAR